MRSTAELIRTPPNPQTGAWLSLVERLLWEQDVGGSNPLAPTTSRSVTSSHLLRRDNGSMARARIYRPAKTAMQSGRAQSRKWILEYEQATPRRPDRLMGWTSAKSDDEKK